MVKIKCLDKNYSKMLFVNIHLYWLLYTYNDFSYVKHFGFVYLYPVTFRILLNIKFKIFVGCSFKANHMMQTKYLILFLNWNLFDDIHLQQLSPTNKKNFEVQFGLIQFVL